MAVKSFGLDWPLLLPYRLALHKSPLKAVSSADPQPPIITKMTDLKSINSNALGQSVKKETDMLHLYMRTLIRNYCTTKNREAFARLCQRIFTSIWKYWPMI